MQPDSWYSRRYPGVASSCCERLDRIVRNFKAGGTHCPVDLTQATSVKCNARSALVKAPSCILPLQAKIVAGF
jgi:hypothetical protein